ncbi:MAG: hypothetical protein WB630_21455 [Candidatus Acidiferrales bacterium]
MLRNIEWLYQDSRLRWLLSADYHLARKTIGTGFIKAFLSKRTWGRQPCGKTITFWWGQTITLMLALASELEAYFKFGLRERIQYLWGLTVPVIVLAKEVYDKRYAALFGR